MHDDRPTRILFYGRLADLLGPQLDLAAPRDSSVAEIRERIAATHPHAAQALRNRRVRACIGDSFVPDSHRVTPGDQVEFLSPVSGG